MWRVPLNQELLSTKLFNGSSGTQRKPVARRVLSSWPSLWRPWGGFMPAQLFKWSKLLLHWPGARDPRKARLSASCSASCPSPFNAATPWCWPLAFRIVTLSCQRLMALCDPLIYWYIIQIFRNTRFPLFCFWNPSLKIWWNSEVEMYQRLQSPTQAQTKTKKIKIVSVFFPPSSRWQCDSWYQIVTYLFQSCVFN